MKSIHFKAIGILIAYTLFTTLSLIIGALKTTPAFAAYAANIFFSALFGVMFLYLFSHEDFFKFAREIERKNIKKEKSFTKKFIRYGKLVSVFTIGLLTNPLITALTIRFLFHKASYKYLLIIITSIASAVFWLSIARGIIVLR